MVKLFKRKDPKTSVFKFNASIKIKDLPNEEYSHVAFAFKTAVLRFERMLKESLLEGYITSTTLERISQEFNFAMIRDIPIPESDTVQAIFGQESAELVPKPSIPIVEKEVVSDIVVPTEPESVAPTPVVTPEKVPLVEEPPEAPTPATAKTPAPQISFSFPTAASEPLPTVSPKPVPSVSAPEQKSEEKESAAPAPLSPPSIPKISFPTATKPAESTPINPLAQVRGRREEDRATGIAILRKQMLTELKKIRSVVAEQDQT